MNILYSLRTPTIFGHRGSCAHAPENTLPAFQKALEQGAEGIELDTKLTVDGIPVVIHDQTVDRTTGGHGEVRRLPLAALRELDAGSFFSPAFKGVTIPTLDEVFASFGKKLYINVELTNYASPGDGLCKIVVDLVKRHSLQDHIMFSSFNPFNIQFVRKALPETPAALLAAGGVPGAIANGVIGRWFSPAVIHPHLRDVTEAYMAKERSRKRRVHVWTVNQEEDIRRLFAMQVQGIITDDVHLACAIRDGK